MSGFWYELKKIMIWQRGALYLGLVLLLSVFLLIVSDSPYDSSMEQYKNEYEWYLDKVNGYCTADKAAYLEQEALAIAEAKRNINTALENYYDGKISEDEYDKLSTEYNAILEKQDGFEVIYQQYLYICENIGNCYFLQTNGWAGLLNGGTLNFLLVFGILLFVTPVFCSEYSCQMDALILTAKEGRKSSRYKILIILSGVLLLCISISLMEYIFYNLKYGLPNGNYPIQSLCYFADSSKSVTLFEGYLYIGLLRSFGGIFLAILLMFISVLTRKYTFTLLAGAVSVILPYIGLSKTGIYHLPLPLPFLLGTDFFSGSIISNDALTGEAMTVFSEISTVSLWILLSVSFVICIMAILWIFRCSTNRWQMNVGKKCVSSLVLIFCLLFTMTGCSGDDEKGSPVYNSSAVYDGMGYEIIQDTETLQYLLKNNLTGETIDLVRSPMFGVFSDEEKVLCYFVNPTCLYYTTLTTQRHVDRIGNYNSSTTKVSVIKLNLSTFEEKTIFEQVTDSGHSILGIEYETGDKWEFLQYHSAFFLNHDDLFFVGNDGIRKVNRSTKSITKIDIPTNGNIAFDGENIFYKNEQSVLKRYDISTNETMLYENIIVSDFGMDEQFIYYVSRADQSAVYACDKEGNYKRLISDIPAMAVTCDTEHIYVLEKQSGEKICFPKETN